MKEFNAQSGNVILIILIAIALFAALSFTVMESMKGGGKNIDEETLSLQSYRIRNYGNALTLAARRLVARNNIGPADIDLSPPGDASYGVPDPRLELFNPAGGDAPYDDMLDVVTPGNFIFHPYVLGVGRATGMDMVYYQPGLTLEQCEQINGDLGLASPPETLNSLVNFNTYSGKTAACINQNWDASATGYAYYHVMFPS